MQIQKPTKEELTPLFIEATENQTAQKWEQRLIQAIADILRERPLRYRTYGPYWWVVKRALIDAGVTDFGDHIDQEWFDALNYGDPAYNLLAAWAYEDARFAGGQMIENPYHTLTDADGEAIEYACNDEQMEAMAMAEALMTV
jgi:hypothetical protein